LSGGVCVARDSTLSECCHCWRERERGTNRCFYRFARGSYLEAGIKRMKRIPSSIKDWTRSLEVGKRIYQRVVGHSPEPPCQRETDTRTAARHSRAYLMARETVACDMLPAPSQAAVALPPFDTGARGPSPCRNHFSRRSASLPRLLSSFLPSPRQSTLAMRT
jgi:hypothetical protein